MNAINLRERVFGGEDMIPVDRAITWVLRMVRCIITMDGYGSGLD